MTLRLTSAVCQDASMVMLVHERANYMEISQMSSQFFKMQALIRGREICKGHDIDKSIWADLHTGMRASVR